MLFSDTGLFEKAQGAEDAYKIGALKDQISTIILDWEIEKRIPNTTGDETTGTLDGLWDKFVDADIIDDPEEDIYHEDGTDIYEVTTNEGYVVEIIVKEDGTVEIGDIVKGDNLPPRIGKITSSGTSNSIHVEVSITRSTGETQISYYYKKEGEPEESYITLKEEVEDLTADFTGLEQNVVYNIKVVVTDDNGSAEKVINQLTGELAEGTITQVGEPEWNNGTATIQLETSETGVDIVYQIGDIDGEWLPYPEEGISGLNHGDIVYAAISDGTNVSKESSFEVEDGIAPTVNITQGTITTKSIAVSVSATDGEWGMPEPPTYHYYIKKSTDNSYPSTASYTGSNTSYTFDNLSQTTSYDIKVTTVDKAGNEGSKELKGISTGTVGGATGNLVSGNIIASNPTWSGGLASITLSKGSGVASNLSIQWQKNSITGTWTTGTSVTGLNHNDIVYARLTDGVNAGSHASVTIKDGTAPTVTVTKGAVTTKSIAVSVSSSDSQWGMPSSISYSYYIKTSSATSYPTAASYTGTNTSYTFNNLSQNTSYDIRVTTKDKAGNTGSKDLTGTKTGAIGGATGNLVSGNIIASSPTWSNNTASITLSKGSGVASNLSIQWQKNSISGTWTTGTSVTGLNHNDIVYARLTDGVNHGQEASVTIKDGTAPTVNITKGTVTTKSIAVSVNSSDSQWGMPSSISYSYYIKTSSATSYPTAASYTGTNTSYTFNNLSQNTSYDIRVTTKDKAGNTGSKDLTGTKTGAVGGATGNLVSGNIIASSPTWSGGKASITLRKGTGVASNLSIQWQKNSISGTWTTGTSVTGLNHNDIVYARLTDGVNAGSHASVTIKDGTAPSIPTVNTNGYVSDTWTNKNITLSFSSSDNESGLLKYQWSPDGLNIQDISNPYTWTTNTRTGVYVRAVDNAGNYSGWSAGVIIAKDTTAPSTASLTVGTVTETSIAVTARGADSLSGVYSYQFQRSTTSATSGFTTVATQTSTATSYAYTYTGLTAGTTYYLRVVVTDRAGNTRTGTAVTQTKDDPASIANVLEEGDWVNYVDKNGTTRKCIVLYGPENSNYSSYGIQIITDDTVEFINFGDSNFTTSMNSYNNVISTLNTRAETYLNTTYASDARSVGSVPDNKNSQSGYYTRSDSWFSSYNGKLRDEDTNYETDLNQMENLGIQLPNTRYYWLASRWVRSYLGPGRIYFNIRRVGPTGNLDYSWACVISERWNRDRQYAWELSPPCLHSKIRNQSHRRKWNRKRSIYLRNLAKSYQFH